MPFTLSHPAIVLPLARSPLVPSALVMGSVAPDLPYFLPVLQQRWLTHRFTGAVTLDLGLAMLLLLLFHAVLKWPLIALCPAWLRRRLVAPASGFARRGMGDLGWLVLSACAGAVSHVGWDAFTHADAPGVRRFPVLGEQLAFGLPGFKVAQYASGIIGLAVIAGWVLWWLRRAVPADDVPPGLHGAVRTAVAAATAVAATAGAYYGAAVWLPLNAGRTDLHARLVGGVIGTIAFAVLALILYGLWFQASARRPPAPA